MNFLILNASPKAKGTVSRQLQAIADELQSKGHAVTSLDIRSLRISPCMGCMHCRTANKCQLKEDDAAIVLDRLREAQALIVGTPCYWGNLPGPLKVLLDRLAYGLIYTPRNPYRLPAGRMGGRRALVFVASTAPWPFHLLPHQARGTASALRHILRSAGIRPVKTLYRPGTSRSAVGPDELRRRARRACAFLASRPRAIG